MYFFIAVVLCFIFFMILYGRYMNVNGSIKQRSMQLDNLRDDVDFKVGRLRKGTAQIRREIAEAESHLESLKQALYETGSSE